MAADQATGGYWLVASDGGIFAFGAAASTARPAALVLNRPVVGMAANAATGGATGWWRPTAAIFAFGDAAFDGLDRRAAAEQAGRRDGRHADGPGLLVGGRPTAGSSPSATPPSTAPPAPSTLTKPIVGMAATPTGLGYWLVGSDGGIFTFGDALFYGSRS